MFEPISSASYSAHLFLVAGQSANAVDGPDSGGSGCDAPPGSNVPLQDPSTGQELAPGVFPCFNIPTLGDVMDQHGVSWRFYAPGLTDPGHVWSSYDSFADIRYGPDWSSKVINPPGQILTDVGNGELAAMTWVTPTYQTSDHPGNASNSGPAWVTSIVDAIGQSQFWNSTAIFVTWDDWGGWYDHVPPPVSQTNPYFAWGLRVPVIVISPYARPAYVSHVLHTTGSILHFAEVVFDLPRLGEEDARDDDFTDAFNFSQAPTPFTPFARTRPKAEIMRAAGNSPQNRMPAGKPDTAAGD
jgi:phospholipase C